MIRWIVFLLLIVTFIVFFLNRVSNQGSGSLAGIFARAFHQDQVRLGVAETDAERREIDALTVKEKPLKIEPILFTPEKEDLTVRASLWQPRLQALNRAVDADVIYLLGRFKEDMVWINEKIRTRPFSEIVLAQVEKTQISWGKIKTVYGIEANDEASLRVPAGVIPACSSDGKDPAVRLAACRQAAMQELVALNDALRLLGEKINDARLKDRGVLAERMQKHQEFVERVANVAEKGYRKYTVENSSDQLEKLRQQQEKARQMHEKARVMQESAKDKFQAMRDRQERTREPH